MEYRYDTNKETDRLLPQQHNQDQYIDKPGLTESLIKMSGVKTKKGRWMSKTTFSVYFSQFLSAWGDRMWTFGIGLFFQMMEGDTLRLVAIYGAVSGCAVLFFGVVIGDWVDKTERLRAAQISLVVQNLSVILCTVGLYLYFHYSDEIAKELNGHLPLVLKIAFITVAVVADLGSLGRKIAVERDWIVEISGDNKDQLAKMTSIMRIIDQSSKILAPVLTGQILTFASVEIGGLFIAGWNAVSVFVEYFFLWKVYQLVPALKNKRAENKRKKLVIQDPESPEHGPPSLDSPTGSHIDVAVAGTSSKHLVKDEDHHDPSKENCCMRMFSAFISVYKGWGTYIHYDEAYAGFGLALLYMTVLGFDNITIAYGYTQGLSAAAVSGMMAGAGLAGILGSVAYPFIRKLVGLERTGLFALSEQLFFLSFCVVAIWMPGSVFDPYYFSNQNELPITEQVSTQNMTFTDGNLTTMSVSSGLTTTSMGVNNSCDANNCGADVQPNVSVFMLFAAMILARFGLWAGDLTITQAFLENVAEKERGAVNGVQESLNKFMDILKFILVIILPQPEVFGFLIIVSFLFVCSGFASYCVYSRKKRGHILPHCEKQKLNGVIASHPSTGPDYEVNVNTSDGESSPDRSVSPVDVNVRQTDEDVSLKDIKLSNVAESEFTTHL